MTYTATPWQVNVTKMDGAITHWHIAGAKHGSAYPICNHTIEQEPSGAEQLENAAFIVRACNTHDDLVAMLQEIVSADDAALAELAAMGMPVTLGVSALTEKARTLLAKVAP